ncbi:MAG: DUF5069 domain-containing protein [Candidatus Velthaea sp.]
MDRARPSLGGGSLGTYSPLNRGLAAMFLRSVDVAPEDFVAAVQSAAASDQDVVAWLHERAQPSAITAVCERLRGFKTRDIPAEERPFVERLYEAHRLDDYETAFDLLDTDDRLCFERRANSV